MSSFCNRATAYFFIAALSLLLLLEFAAYTLQLLLIGLYPGLVHLGLLSEEVLLSSIGVAELFVAHFPDAVEEGSCKAIDGEDLPASVAEVDEDEHCYYETWVFL